jgi:glycosyltransferase involved in cell wall biosynthesis
MAWRRRYDVVHGVEDAALVGVAVTALAGGKLVFEKHSDPFSYRRGRIRNLIMGAYAAVERFVARRADAVIGTGPGLVAQIRKMNTRAAIHHIFDIPSSLEESDPRRASEIRASLRPQGTEILVTFVGSFAVYQGVDLLFESVPQVARVQPAVRFVIIGGTEREIEERGRWLAERGAAGAVHFAGKVPPDELPDYLAASDILLSPRLSGVNTPLKLLDYLKAGRAILATGTEANRLILHERVAVLVEPRADALAEGVCRLAQDGALRAALGAAGRALFEDRYTFEAFKTRLGVCYEEMLGRGEARPGAGGPKASGPNP